MRSSTITEQSVAHKGPVVRIPQNGMSEEVNSTVQQNSTSPLPELGLYSKIGGRYARADLPSSIARYDSCSLSLVGLEKDLPCWVSDCAWIVVDACATPSSVPIAGRLLVAGIAT